jgi:tetratricopeptide (TPR) repeat protein
MQRRPGRLRSVALCLAVWASLAACSPRGNSEQDSAADVLLRVGAGENGPAARGPARAAELLLEAEQAANNGRDDEARSAYDRALAIYEDAGDLSGQGTTLLGLATLARYGGQGEVSREIYARAREAFESGDNDVGAARVLYAVAELERARFNNEEALADFTNAEAVFHEAGEWEMEAWCLLGVGEIERRRRNILKSRDAMARARVIFEVIGHSDGLTVVTEAQLELVSYFNEYDGPRLAAATQADLGQQAVDPIMEADAYLLLGRTEVLAGRPRQARDSLAKALELYSEAGDLGVVGVAVRFEPGVAAAALTLAAFEHRLGNLGLAADSYAQALTAYRRTEDATGAALTLIGLGELETEHEIDARTLFTEARGLVAEGEAPEVDGALLLGFGRLDHRFGRAEEAAEAFAAAEELYRAAGLILGMGEALLSQAHLQRDLGGLEAAHELYMRARNAFTLAQDRIGEAESRLGWAAVLAELGTGPMEANFQYRIAAAILTELTLNERAAAAVSAANDLN